MHELMGHFSKVSNLNLALKLMRSLYIAEWQKLQKRFYII